MIADEYLREGKLTAFSGIPFDDENPYNYVEARRVLRLAMQDLRQRSDLRKELGIDPEGPGRPAITGREGSHVWDFIHVKKAGDEQMTRVPHVTLAIHTDHALAITIIPHGMKSHFRRNLLELGPDGFFRLVKQIEKNLAKSLRNAVSYKPWMEVLQRRYRTPSSLPTVDARLEFDLRTAFESQKGGPKLQSDGCARRFQLTSINDRTCNWQSERFSPTEAVPSCTARKHSTPSPQHGSPASRFCASCFGENKVSPPPGACADPWSAVQGKTRQRKRPNSKGRGTSHNTAMRSNVQPASTSDIYQLTHMQHCGRDDGRRFPHGPALGSPSPFPPPGGRGEALGPLPAGDGLGDGLLSGPVTIGSHVATTWARI